MTSTGLKRVKNDDGKPCRCLQAVGTDGRVSLDDDGMWRRLCSASVLAQTFRRNFATTRVSLQ